VDAYISIRDTLWLNMFSSIPTPLSSFRWNPLVMSTAVWTSRMRSRTQATPAVMSPPTAMPNGDAEENRLSVYVAPVASLVLNSIYSSKSSSNSNRTETLGNGAKSKSKPTSIVGNWKSLSSSSWPNISPGRNPFVVFFMTAST